MPPSFFAAGSPSYQATVRILPTTDCRASAEHLRRLKEGRCVSLVLAGISRGTWTLKQFCSILEAASHLRGEITNLDFSKMDLDETFLEFAIDLIARCPKLKRLEMEHNSFSEKSARWLGRALRNKKNLSYLNLSHCHLNDKSLMAFFRAALGVETAADKSVENDDNGGDVNYANIYSVLSSSSAASTSSAEKEAFFASANGFALHLAHNQLLGDFVPQLSTLIESPKQHFLNSISLFGNFVHNDDAKKLHTYCQQRRDLIESRRRNEAGGNNNNNNGPSSPSFAPPRTSLGFLVECCSDDASEKGAFPTVSAMAKMLVEEEGL